MTHAFSCLLRTHSLVELPRKKSISLLDKYRLDVLKPVEEGRHSNGHIMV